MRIFITAFLLFFCCAKGFSQGYLQGRYNAESHLFIPTDTAVKIAVMHEGRIAFVKNNMVGFIDSTGRIAVPAAYNLYTPFKNGIALMMNAKRKYGMVDTEGRVVLPFEYDYFYFTSSADFFVMYKNGFAGLIDSRGNVLIPANKYKMFYQPSKTQIRECSLQFRTANSNPYLIRHTAYNNSFELDNYMGVLRDSLWGYADTSGREIIAPKYKSISLFNHGLACVSEGAGRMLIDTAGTTLFTKDCDMLIPLSSAVIAYIIGTKFGVVTRSGNTVLSAEYDNISLSDNNTLLLLKKGLYGVADLSGKIIAEPKYNSVEAVPHGYVVREFDKGYLLLDSAGIRVSSYITGPTRSFKEVGILSDDYKSGWVYNEQKRIFEKYDWIWPIGNVAFGYKEGEKIGLLRRDAAAKTGPLYDKAGPVEINTPGAFKVSEVIRVVINGKYGLMDTDLNMLLPAEYDMIDNFTKGIAAVKKDGKYGFINRKGSLITPLKYDWAVGGYSYHEYRGKRYEDPLLQVGIGGRYGYIDSTGKEVTPIKYEHSYGSTLGNYFLKADGKSGMTDSTGREVIPYIYDRLDFFEHMRDVILAEKDGKQGVVSITGRIIIPVVYDKIETGSYADSSFILYQNGKGGVMDHEGKTILPFQYDRIEFSGHGFWLLKNDKQQYGFFSTRLQKIFAPEYDDAFVAGDNLLLVRKGDLWGVANTENRLIYPLKYKAGHAYSNAIVLTEASGKTVNISTEDYIFPERRVQAIPQILPDNFLPD